MSSLYQALLEQISRMPVIDTHEHLPYSDETRDRGVDVLKEYLGHYMSSDLISAGLSPENLKQARDTSLPLLERWRLIEPYWEACRCTGYGRSLDLAVKGIYGIDGIRAATLEELDGKFRSSLAPGHFRHVLQDLCNIELSIIDPWSGQFECDRSLFRRSWQPGTHILQFTNYGPFSDIVAWYMDKYSVAINGLDDWVESFDRELDDNLANGIIALKFTIAYDRSLHFPDVDYGVAAAAFSETLAEWRRSGNAKAVVRFPADVQNYMMHHVLKRANERALACQFHTGMLEGVLTDLGNVDPALMTNLFTKYRDIKFDLFHISYPFYLKAAALCKSAPNIFIDMCWAHIISPNASRLALSEFLDAVPSSKISAFGGDYQFVDGIYGHLQIARENVSRVLAEKVEDGVFSADKALEIAHGLFYDNPKRIFGL